MSAPGYLSDPSLRLILFGGKGGVGKTTMACASALHLAIAYPGQKVLLISTDPAHSLADCLGLPIGDRISPIHYRPTSFNPGASSSNLGFQASGSPNLFAWEPDTGRLAEEFKTQHREALKKLADRGTYFDETDIAQFMDLSIPGMDEVMAILEISRLMAEGTYDRLIVDTAPTGHTIRMLGLPEQMLLWVKALDLMQEKHRVMVSHFNRGRVTKDECDAFIKGLSSDLATVKKLFADGEKTRFVPVTLPEPMVIDETLRLVARLRALSVPVHEILVNRVALAQNCPFCRSRAEDQAVYLKMLERELAPCTLFSIPLFSREIQGVAGLQELGQVLWGGKKIPPGQSGVPIASPSPATLTFKEIPELILVGGKGGVGKTSVASAIALHLARTDPSRKVLLFSTDPAHSLSDALSLPIGNQVTPIPLHKQRSEDARRKEQGSIPHSVPLSNLFALEIDSDRLFQNLKDDFETDIQEVFERFLKSGLHARLDQEVTSSLLNFAPPGIDEIMALNTVMVLKAQGDFDILVLDTSPTGHLLRFLELPELVRQWLQAFFRLLIRYKGVVRLTRVAEKAVNMAKGIRQIHEALTDPRKTAFVAVTLAEGLAMEELADLMKALKTSARIHCRHIVVNRIIPDSECPFCRSARNTQERYLKGMASVFSACTVIPLPHFPQPIQGMEALGRLEAALFRGLPF